MTAWARYALTTGLTAAVVLGLAAFLGMISYRHPARHDFTKNKRHSLAEQTVHVLEELEQPVSMLFFMKDGDPSKPAVLDLLELYRFHSDQFRFEAVDPDLSPSRARDYNLDQYGIPVAFLETEPDRRESVTGIAGIDSKEALEELMTNGLIRVTRGRTKKIYALTGHGEAALEGDQVRTIRKAKAALEDKSYELAPLQLLGQTRVPIDCDVLLIVGPVKELDPTELQAVRRYLEDGGRAAVALDPQTSRGLAAVVNQFGLVVGDDIIIDFNALNQLLGGDPLVPIAAQYGQHAITRNFTMATFFPQARSVETAGEPGPYRATALIQTSPDSFAETSFEELQTGRVTMGPDDRRGPVSVAVVVEWTPEGEAPATQPSADAPSDAPTSAPTPASGRLAVFGDSDFITDQHFDSMGNSDLFLNVVNWLAQEEDLIAIRPKTSETQFITLTATQGRIIFLVPIVVLPGIVLFAGGAVWFRRRQG